MTQSKLELVFKETKKLKFNAKELKMMISDALMANEEYKSLKDQLTAIKEKMRLLNTQVVNSMYSKEIEKLDEIKIDLQSQKIMATDIALSKLMAGETVEVVDDNGVVYEPIWSVRFKKTDRINNKNGETN